MPQITLTDIIVESDLIALKEEIDRAEKHIIDNIPSEILFVPGGNPNTHNRFGALLMHLRHLRATIRAF